MARCRAATNAHSGRPFSPSHRIKKSSSNTSNNTLQILYENQPITGTHKAQRRQFRRSARLNTLSRSQATSRRRGAESGLSTLSETLLDQVQRRHSNSTSIHCVKRKRGQDVPESYTPAQDPSPTKRLRSTARRLTADRPFRAGQIPIDAPKPLSSWILNNKWPREYFEPDAEVREGLCERDSWLDNIMAQPPIPAVQYVERNGFRYPQPMRKAPSSLRRKQSDSSINESNDPKKRESKSAPYRDARYATMLEKKGTFLRDIDHEVPQAAKDICHLLLNTDQIVPHNSLFRDDLFSRLCWKIQDRNEAMIIQDITRLIVPSAMNLAIYGDKSLDVLVESANEAWTGSIPVEGPRPQPDYAVGFNRSAFTNEQLQKLDPLIGSVFDTSVFVASYRMYFPFLTCEVKCGAAALDIADRQNAHSMTIAVRSVVELYKTVKREKELDRTILAFSLSHDHRSVRIYGHYSVIDEDSVTFYRHPIREFSFVEMDGREKWTTYKFVKTVYNAWMPTHLQRICSAIDQLPSSLDFEVAEEPGVQFEEGSGLSRNMDSVLSGPSDVDMASQTGQEDDEQPLVVEQTATPDTSVSTRGKQGAVKRPKRGRSTK